MAQRIEYKLAVLAPRNGTVVPGRRTSPVGGLREYETRTRLRSASTSSLSVRRTRLSTVGDRAFSVAATRTWNDLPRHVTSAPSLPVFCSRLKTHLFRRSNFLPVTFVVPVKRLCHYWTL